MIMQARLDETLRRGGTICVPVGTVAQAWRSPRQARLARLLRSRDVDIAIITPNVARSVGLLCARSGHPDVIDVHVALCARERRHAVVTSDLEDMSRIDRALPVIRA
jgi:predicted nucleic acid-binding protein